MAYVKTSTENPLGHKPWHATLQPGGLGKLMGAFFPNAEALGPNSVMVDRDAGNPNGWKGAPFAGAPIPRAYYPPDARLQYLTPRGQGLGAVLAHSAALPLSTSHIASTPIVKSAAPIISVAQPIVAGATPVIVARPTPVTVGTPGYVVAPTAPLNHSTSNVGTTPGAPVTAGAPFHPPTSVTVTTPSGSTITQSVGSTAAQVSGTPVPVGTALSAHYSDSSGNVWLFNGTTWYNATAQVAGTPVPLGTSTTTTYTDAGGNVWTFNGSVWASPTVASGSSISNYFTTGWLESNTIFSAVPNYVTIAGAGLLAYLMFKKK